MILLIDRMKDLRRYSSEKGPPVPKNYSKIRVGGRTIEDAILSLGDLKRVNPNLADKTQVLQAIDSFNVDKMREISNFFYRSSGIYSRLCRYMAYLYRYDWFITPYINGCEGLLDQDSGVGNVDTEQ